METMTEKLLEWFSSHREEMVSDLAELIRIPSVLSAPQPGAPFGKDCADCLEACAAMYRRHGLEVRLFPEEGYALAFLGEGKKEIGIFAHSDVVPVHEAEWIKTSPFEMKVEGDVAYGRGVSDNKEAVVGALYLLLALRELRIPLRHRLAVFIGSNEESGMKDISAYARSHPMPSVSLVPDSGFPVSLGEKGVLRLDIWGSRSFEDLLDIRGGSAYNIVMPDLECRLVRSEGLIRWLKEAPETWMSMTEEEGSVRLTVSGVAAHGASPKLGVSALYRLATKLRDCPALKETDREQMQRIAEALSDADGKRMGIDSHDPVLGDLSAANGMVSMKDGKIMFTLDIRYGETTTSARILSGLEEYFAPVGIRPLVHSDSTPFHLPPDSAEAQTILSVFREYTGNQEANYFYMSGGTYAKHLKNAFATGCLMEGPEEFPELPEGHGRGHQPDERMSITGWLKSMALLGTMISRLDGLHEAGSRRE